MKKCILIIIILFVNVIEIYSLPRFALRYSDKCSNCHINYTGGGMRNEDGFVFARNVISMFKSSGEEVFISPKIFNNISFGFDYRTQFLYSGEKRRGDFQDMSGSVYINAKASEKIDITAKYDFVQSIWEGFASARILPNDSYIKAGTFTPDYGIKLDDHTAYTRGGDFGLLFANGSVRGLLFNPFYNITGIETGININSITLLTASIGKSRFTTTLTTDPVFTGRIELTPSINNIRFSAGASVSTAKTRFINQITGDQDLLPTKLWGVFGGFGVDRFAFQGEYDIAEDYTGRGLKSNALMLEASYLLFTGFEAVLRYDRFVPDDKFESSYFSHLVAGAEIFPYNFIEIRPQIRFNMSGQYEGSSSFLVQLHFYY